MQTGDRPELLLRRCLQHFHPVHHQACCLRVWNGAISQLGLPPLDPAVVANAVSGSVARFAEEAPENIPAGPGRLLVIHLARWEPVGGRWSGSLAVVVVVAIAMAILPHEL